MSSVAFLWGIPQGAAGPERGVETPNLMTSCAGTVPGAKVTSAATVRNAAQVTERGDLIATPPRRGLGQRARRTRTIGTPIALVNGGQLSRRGHEGEAVMRIVDAQIHLWGSGLPSNMAHRQVTSFTTEEAMGLMNEGGVDAAVIHPPGWDPNSTEMAFKAVRDFPGRFAILGSLPLNQPDKRPLVEK